MTSSYYNPSRSTGPMGGMHRSSVDFPSQRASYTVHFLRLYE